MEECDHTFTKNYRGTWTKNEIKTIEECVPKFK